MWGSCCTRVGVVVGVGLRDLVAEEHFGGGWWRSVRSWRRRVGCGLELEAGDKLGMKLAASS